MPEGLSLREFTKSLGECRLGWCFTSQRNLLPFFKSSKVATKMQPTGRWYIYLPTSPNGKLVVWLGGLELLPNRDGWFASSFLKPSCSTTSSWAFRQKSRKELPSCSLPNDASESYQSHGSYAIQKMGLCRSVNPHLKKIMGM